MYSAVAAGRRGGAAPLGGLNPWWWRWWVRRQAHPPPPSQERSLATRAAGAQCGDPAFVSFFLLPLALVAPSFRRMRPSSHRLSIAPAGRYADCGAATRALDLLPRITLDYLPKPSLR